MTEADAMGLTAEAARGYEAFFVPAIFHQWPARLIERSNVAHGSRVLDVGCGTGVLSRELLAAVGSQGAVTGLDLSESMLGVARQHAPAARFERGDAADLPFLDDEYDAVFSAFMLMFVPDPVTVVREMQRVLRPEGALVLSVWQGLQDNPVYAALAEVMTDVVDSAAGDAVAAPFSLGAPGKLQSMLEAAGCGAAQIEACAGSAEFPSVEELVRTEVQAWVLAGDVSEVQIAQASDALRERLPVFRDAQGPVRFPLNALVAVL